MFVSDKVISLFLYFSNTRIVVVGFPTNMLDKKIAGELIDSKTLKGLNSLYDNLMKKLLFTNIDDKIYIGTIEGIRTFIKIFDTS
jgi:hypothetical protein